VSTGDLTGGRTGGVLECLVPDFSRRPSYCVALWIQGDITEADAVSTLRAMPLAKRCRVPSVHLGRARARTKPDNSMSRHIHLYIYIYIYNAPSRLFSDGVHRSQRDTAKRATPKKAPTRGRRRLQRAGEEGPNATGHREAGNTEEGPNVRAKKAPRRGRRGQHRRRQVRRRGEEVRSVAVPFPPPQDARWFDLCPRGLSNRLVTLGGMG